MKIFIWEDVLRDWSAGMAMAYAETLEEALEELSKVASQLGKPTKIIDVDKDKHPHGVFVYGGG